MATTEDNTLALDTVSVPKEPTFRPLEKDTSHLG